MNINLHIEQLILDGLPVAVSQSAVVQRTVEAELARMIDAEGLPGLYSSAIPHLSGGTIQFSKDSRPANLGNEVARAVHTALAPSTARRESRRTKPTAIK